MIDQYRFSRAKDEVIYHYQIKDNIGQLKEKFIHAILKRYIEFDEKYHEIARDIDEITDYYMSKKEEFDVVIEEGDYIANELLFKVIGYNNQQLDLPIDVSCIRKYCLSSKIKTEQVYDVLLWIVIRYVTIQKCVSY